MLKIQSVFENSKKNIQRLLLAFSNISRGLFVSIIGLFINYVLLNYKSADVLNAYVYCVTIVNLLFVICNWGGKDHSIKTLAANPGKTPELLNSIFLGRILLFVFVLIPVLFLPQAGSFKLFVGGYLLLKLIGSPVEAVISVRKKFHFFLLIDFILNVTLLFVILFDGNKTQPEIFFGELLAIEFFRVTTGLLFFKKLMLFKIDLKKLFSFLKDSRHFFYIAAAGFLCSRADLYIVGILLDQDTLSRYFIILNLVILGQVVYSTFISTFGPNILRYSEKTFHKFREWSFRAGVVFSLLCTAAIFIVSSIYYRIPLSPEFTAMIFVNILFFTFIVTHVLLFTRSNKQRIMANILSASGLLNIILSFLLVHFLGIEGAFLSNTLSLIFNFMLFRKFRSSENPDLTLK